MSELSITLTQNPKQKPDYNNLGFGHYFTDHMFIMNYNPEQGWHNPRVEPYHKFDMDPATMVLHYGQAIFEGIKAYKNTEGKVQIFRPLGYLNRFNQSARRLCIPEMDVDTLYNGLTELVKIDADWIPTKPGTSLYIRPTVIATDPYLGVKPSDNYICYIILSPVGAYYPEGFKPVKIYVTDKYVRAVPGGLGFAKTPANYAASLAAQVEAKKLGYTQVLWLDAIERKYIEEVGTMNIFLKINDELITPVLEGSILGGMTRDSVITMAKSWGVKVVERRISIDEVFAAHANGSLKEVFGTGTAAVISPVSTLVYKDQEIIINNGQVGELSDKLYNAIDAIQYGTGKDPFEWADVIE